MKPATTLSILLLLVIAAGQMTRFIARWPIQIATYSVPLWVSLVAAVVAGLLAVGMYMER